MALVACGQPAAFHETRQTHATRGAVPAAPIDPATIDQLDDAALQAALAQSGSAAPTARLALRAARLAHHRGDDDDARAFLARAASAADEASVHDKLAALAAELVASAVDPAAIAVILPLTGRYSAIGSELRTAIELANPDGTHWVFLDTRGEPEGARAAVAAAVAKGAIAILGPVGEREAIAAAREAALAGIPIGLLAPADGASAQAGVFRLVGSPADEARAIAKLALDDSFPTVGVFAPRDDIGQEAADEFAAEATRLGVDVTATGSYDPTGGDLEPDVKRFLNLIPGTNPKLAEHLAKYGKKGWATFSPDIPYTLLYIPDRYDRAALVAAYLPYFNVELRTGEIPDPRMLMRKHNGKIPEIVQLVGGAGWHHPSLPLRGGAAVQGALIVDAFAGDLSGDAAAAFDAAFQQRVGREASSAAAEAFDAATLIARARKEATTRWTMRGALAHAHLEDGACGPVHMTPEGEVDRAFTVLEVSGDQLVAAP